MGINVGNLNASLTLQSAQFMASMKAAAAQSQATSKAINSAMGFAKGAVLGLAGAFSVDMFSKIIKGAFDYADAIQDLSDRTGASTKFIQEFGYAAQLSGSSVENARTGIEKFSKNLGTAIGGNQEMIKTLKSLGVTSTDTDTAIKQAADGISKIKDKSEQAAVTVKLFGKSGQDLVMTLSDGAKGLEEWGNKAQALGIVLSPQLIANAGKVNDKLDTMQMILSAKTAGAIIENADAIGALADQFLRLGVAAANAFKSMSNSGNLSILDNPTLTRLSSKLLGNDPAQTSSNAFNALLTNKEGRDELLHRNTSALNALEAAGKGKGLDINTPGLDDVADNPASRKAAYDRLMAERKKIQAAYKAVDFSTGTKPPAGGLIPDAKAPKTTTDNSAAKAAAAEKSFNDALAAGKIEALRLKSDIDPSIITRSQNDRDINTMMRDRANSDINDDLATGKFGTNKDIANARADQLKALNEQNYMLQADVINHRENAQVDADALDVRKATLANDNEIANGSLSLARSQTERRSIMLRILDNQLAQERAENEAVIASKDSTDAQKKIAAARLDMLGTLKSQGQQSIAKETMGPLQSYFDNAPKSADEMRESLESVATDGLDRLTDGFANAVTGAGSLKDAIHDVMTSALTDLAKIEAKKLITGIGSSLLGGLFGGASSLAGLGAATSSSLTDISKGLSLSKLGIGARANGGFTSPGMYKVGERGEEVINVGQPSSVVTTRELRAMGASNDNARGGVNVTVNGVNDPAMIRRAAAETFAQLQPVSTAITSDTMNKKASYPRMR